MLHSSHAFARNIAREVLATQSNISQKYITRKNAKVRMWLVKNKNITNELIKSLKYQK